jgi:hypothetical protein
MICNKTEACANCHDHYQQLRPLVKEIVVTKQFHRDVPDFDINAVVDCKHAYFTHLHKFEETIDGNHVFRALKDKVHVVYCIDRQNRLLFLRAFHNFSLYRKFLNDKKEILAILYGDAKLIIPA